MVTDFLSYHDKTGMFFAMKLVSHVVGVLQIY